MIQWLTQACEHTTLQTVKQTLHLIRPPPKLCVFVTLRNSVAWREDGR